MPSDAHPLSSTTLLLSAVATALIAVVMDLWAGEHPVHAATVGVVAAAVAAARLVVARRFDGLLVTVNCAVVAQPALHASTKLLPPIADHSGEMSLSVVHVVLAALIAVVATQIQQFCSFVAALRPLLHTVLTRIVSTPRRPVRSPRLVGYEPALPIPQWSVVRDVARRGPPPSASAARP